MKTLYLRNVPDEVAEGLEYLAARESMSVSAFAVKELTKTARRARNADVLDALPDLKIGNAAILKHLHAGREER